MSGEKILTVDQVNEITGDDITYWLGNPFLTPDMLIAKVCWWMTQAAALVPSEVAETTAGEHHPACYQSTGVPDHLPAGLCDCKVLRMLDAAETTAGEREVEALADVLLASWAAQGSLHPPFDTDRDDARQDARAHVATHLAALLDRVRREEGERIAQAIEELPAHYVQSTRRGGTGWVQAVQTHEAVTIARAASVGRGEGQ